MSEEASAEMSGSSISVEVGCAVGKAVGQGWAVGTQSELSVELGV
jgi:hypothetical protein